MAVVLGSSLLGLAAPAPLFAAGGAREKRIVRTNCVRFNKDTDRDERGRPGGLLRGRVRRAGPDHLRRFRQHPVPERPPLRGRPERRLRPGQRRGGLRRRLRGQL